MTGGESEQAVTERFELGYPGMDTEIEGSEPVPLTGPVPLIEPPEGPLTEPDGFGPVPLIEPELNEPDGSTEPEGLGPVPETEPGGLGPVPLIEPDGRVPVPLIETLIEPDGLGAVPLSDADELEGRGPVPEKERDRDDDKEKLGSELPLADADGGCCDAEVDIVSPHV